MSKSFKIDINSFSNATDMDSIYAGNSPVENIAEVKAKKVYKKIKTSKNNDAIISNTKAKTSKVDHTKTTDSEGRLNKKNNYALTIKIDEDLKDYLSKIEWVKMLDDRVSTNKNQYINDLIRADLVKRLNLDSNATYEETQKAWDKYKKANNI